MNEKSCSDCKFSILEDTGYSNYTVEGTEFTCFKKAHPDGSYDNWYGEDVRHRYAQKCPSFEAGDGIHMDVDHEEEDQLTPDQMKIWRQYRE